VSRRQFVSGKKPEVGQLIEVFVDRVDEDEGLIHVNLPKGLRKIAGNWESLSVGQIVDCIVTGTNKGGLEVTVSNLRGFLPASQVDLNFVSDLQPFLGQKLRVQVAEVQPRKRNLIVSRRAYLSIERKEAEANIWKTLEVNQVFSGTVKTIKDYGAFVDIGGVDGFLHVGEISWLHIKHPHDVIKEGQQVDVKVIALDPEKKKISLGMKQLTQNPWNLAVEKYAVGSRVQGTVTRTAAFGAFVELEPGVEGLIHISELEHQRVRRVTDVLKVGQAIDAQVLEVDPERKRIALSLKALVAKPEPKSDEDLAPSAGVPFERKRKGSLKGGTSSIGETGSSGGGLFGNPKDWNRR
jgi:ribosomal protein S1